MAVICPISDLRNYNTILEKVSAHSPVYLTLNGRGRYTIRDIEDEEEFEKTKAMLRLILDRVWTEDIFIFIFIYPFLYFRIIVIRFLTVTIHSSSDNQG